MCGLFGIMGQGINSQDQAVLFNLSILSMVRGYDATGIAWGSTWDRQQPSKMFKLSGDSMYFHFMIKDKSFDAVSNNFYIGHTRFATTGKNDKASAHPYDMPNLVGAHNGTLNSIDYKGFSTDSEWFYAQINNLGVQGAVDKLKHDDSYCLTWYDKKERRVKFLRNSRRPLHFAVNSDRSVVYWFSEAELLRATLQRHHIKFDHVYVTTEDLVYSWDPSKIVSKDYQKAYTTEEITVPTKPPIITQEKSNVITLPSTSINHTQSLVEGLPWADFDSATPEQKALMEAYYN